MNSTTVASAAFVASYMGFPRPSSEVPPGVKQRKATSATPTVKSGMLSVSEIFNAHKLCHCPNGKIANNSHRRDEPVVPLKNGSAGVVGEQQPGEETAGVRPGAPQDEPEEIRGARTADLTVQPVGSQWAQWLLEPESFTPELPPRRRKRKGNVASRQIPISCHHVADSLFSTSSGFNDYRGLLNLCLVLLVLSNTRAALENIIKYGILIDPLRLLPAFLREPYSWPSIGIVLGCNIFILTSFCVEKLLVSGHITEKLGDIINGVNILLEIILPAVIVLWSHPPPVFSSVALVICTTVFLKLVSYTRVNAWCRANLREPRLKHKRTKSVGENLDRMGNGKAETLQQYPHNLTISDLYYFMVCPALCYELNFPRSGRIRKRFLIKRALEMGFLLGLMISLVQQWIVPTVNNAMVPFHNQHLPQIVERLLKLAVPNHLIWLIFFYWFFHSCLNVIAELLRFGDRVFYRDWWNAETVQYFWQNWNIPVHKWASRHMYKPMLSSGYSKLQAQLTVFVASALFHEYLVSIPLRMFRLWSFSAMLGQLPLAIFTARYMHGKYGNMAVWMSIIIGQPIAILMYYHDYYIIHYQ